MVWGESANIKLTCPAAQTVRCNNAQEAMRNKSRGRVRCSDRFSGVQVAPASHRQELGREFGLSPIPIPACDEEAR